MTVPKAGWPSTRICTARPSQTTAGSVSVRPGRTRTGAGGAQPGRSGAAARRKAFGRFGRLRAASTVAETDRVVSPTSLVAIMVNGSAPAFGPAK